MKAAAPRFHIALALLLLLGASPLLEAKPQATASVSIKRRIEPRYPAWAYTHGIGSGYAKIAFYVDEQGEASGFIPIEYSYEAFSDELMASLLKWDFVPAHQNGIPFKSVCHAYWEFLPDRAIETNALFDTAKRLEGNSGDDFRTLKLRKDEELDSRIGMIAFPGLALVKGSGIVSEERQSVRARVSFYVDPRGNVALPQIMESSAPQVNEALATDFKQAAFNLPIYKGKPTIALLERTYDFPILWLEPEPVP